MKRKKANSRALRVIRHTEDESRAGAAGSFLYAVFGVMFAYIALFGLLVGFFVPNNLGRLLAGGEPIMRGSLIGVLVELLRGSIPFPAAGGTSLAAVLPFALYFALFLTGAAVLFTVALAAVGLVKRQWAKRAAYINGYTVFFAYAVPCALGLLLSSFRAEMYGWRQLDVAALIPTLLAEAGLTALACLKKGVRGGLQAALLFLSSFGIFAFVFPQTPLCRDLDALFSGGLNWGTRVALLLLCGTALGNFFLSSVRLFKGDRLVFDVIRFGVQFAAALFLIAAYLAGGQSVGELIEMQPLALLFLLLAPLSALLFAAFALTFSPAREKRRKAPSQGETEDSAPRAPLKDDGENRAESA